MDRTIFSHVVIAVVLLLGYCNQLEAETLSTASQIYRIHGVADIPPANLSTTSLRNRLQANMSKSESSPRDPPHAVVFLGVGYNLLFGNPEGGDDSSGGTDPGLLATRRILKLTYDDNKLTPDLQYKIPDQIDYVPRESCQIFKSVDMFYGTKSYQKKLNTDIGVSVGGEVFNGGFDFSYSHRYERTKKDVTTKRVVSREERITCNKGQARYLTELVQPKKYFLEDGFVASACRLPAELDNKTYTDFIDNWGTHVVTLVNVGNQTTTRYQEEMDQFVHYAMKSKSNTVSVKAGYDQYSAGMFVNMGEFDSLFDSKTKFGSQSETYISGSPSLEEPLKVSIMGMQEVFTSSYWQQFDGYVKKGLCDSTWNTTLSKIGANMVNALEYYPEIKGALKSTDPNVSIPITWPQGNYGLPQLQGLQNNCPDNKYMKWDKGWRQHNTLKGNYWSDPYTLQGTVASTFMYQHFCMKTYDPDSYGWQWSTNGKYCIYAGVANNSMSCPQGLRSGHIKWNDYGSKNTEDGMLPYGTYSTGGATIYFCCATDGNPYNPLYLPPDQDFVLFKPKGFSTCQKVYGMEFYEEYFYWSLTGGNQVSGAYPEYGLFAGNHIRLQFCHYTPSKSEEMQ